MRGGASAAIRATTLLVLMCLGLSGFVRWSDQTVHARADAAGRAQAGGALVGSPGPRADVCAPPAAVADRSAASTFSPDTFPVELPLVSLYGVRNDLLNPFQAGVHWGQLPDGRTWGSTAGVYSSADGASIWAIDRCGQSGAAGSACAESPLDPVLQFDTSGRLLTSFGKGLIVSPHKIMVDSEGFVWVADNGSAPAQGHQVLKFSPDGELLMSLGTPGVAGPGLDEFDQPSAVAVAPNGDIFVADGHNGGGTAVGNARIVKFDRNGRFLKTWGKKGVGAGEFDAPHDLAFDSRGLLFVADRANNRIQIFDQDGTFVAQWFQFGRPSGIYIDVATDTLYVADSESRDGRTRSLPPTGYGYNPGVRRGIRIGSARDGSVSSFIPDPCPYPYGGASTFAEGVTVDAEGDIYGADFRGTIRKFVRKN